MPTCTFSRTRFVIYSRPLIHRSYQTAVTPSLTTARAKIAEQIKVDVLSKTQANDNVIRAKEVSRNFVSDTGTVPTQAMYAYAAHSSLGDDAYQEPATVALEEHLARITGKDAALFLPTGIMSNQIALRAHLTQPPYSVIFDERSHISKYGAGGTAFHSGAKGIAVSPMNGHHITLSDVQAHFVPGDDLYSAPTEVIALENTLNGIIIPQDDIISIADFAHSQGIKIHLDGARIWHVAAETGTPLDVLCHPFDSISVCFSKGLGAPSGSCLIGSQKFIYQARKLRKLFGGNMHQTGHLAACAAYAITHNFRLLPAVHALARELEKGLEAIGAEVTSRAETCMVVYDPSPLGLDYSQIAERAAQLSTPINLRDGRLVVHIQTSKEAVRDLLALIKEMAEEKKKIGGKSSDL